MCVRITCADCGKPSFAGCGRHVEQVLRDVPEAERCRCRNKTANENGPKRSLLERLFGKL